MTKGEFADAFEDFFYNMMCVLVIVSVITFFVAAILFIWQTDYMMSHFFYFKIASTIWVATILVGSIAKLVYD